MLPKASESESDQDSDHDSEQSGDEGGDKAKKKKSATNVNAAAETKQAKTTGVAKKTAKGKQN